MSLLFNLILYKYKLYNFLRFGLLDNVIDEFLLISVFWYIRYCIMFKNMISVCLIIFGGIFIKFYILVLGVFFK